MSVDRQTSSWRRWQLPGRGIGGLGDITKGRFLTMCVSESTKRLDFFSLDRLDTHKM